MARQSRGERISEWMQNWNDGLTRFLERRVPVRIDAQDLAQEVYLRLLRVERLDHINEPQAYLYRVARNVASEWRMRARNSKPHASDALDELTAADVPDLLVDRALVQRNFDETLRGMAPMVRAVVFLKMRDEMSHQEIAEHLGITRRMVRRYLAKGYAEMRRRMLLE